MSRRGGFALITVLWLVAAMAAMTTLGLASTALVGRSTENRMLAHRAMWASRSCLAILRSTFASDPGTLDLPPTDLGAGVTCAVHELEPSLRLNINTADLEALTRLLGDAEAASTLLDWRDGNQATSNGETEQAWYEGAGRAPPTNRPFRAVAEVSLVRYFEDIPLHDLEATLTVLGDGRIDPNRAPPDVLRTLTDLPRPAIERVIQLRQTGVRFDDPEEVAVAGGVRLGAEAFRALGRKLVFDSRDHVVRSTGIVMAGSRVVQVHATAAFREFDGRLTPRWVEFSF